MPDITNKPELREALNSVITTLDNTEKYLVERHVDDPKISETGRTVILPDIRAAKKLLQACLIHHCP